MKKTFATITMAILLISIFTTPASARSWDWELPGSVSTIIEDQAEIEHPGDRGMQSYFCKKQARAWLNISNYPRPFGLDERELKRIKGSAAIKWPSDYTMQLYRIKEQITAWRHFENFKQPRNFNSSYKFKKLKKEYERKHPKDYEMRLYKFKKFLMEGS